MQDGTKRLEDLVESSVTALGGGAAPQRQASARKRLVPYGLAGPAVFWLLVFFLIPTIYMGFVSLGSGFLGSIKFGLNFSNYVDVLTTYDKQFIRSVVYALIVTFLALCIAYPLAYWIALYGGKRKNVFFLLILLPFFVSFVIRTVQWQFILADERHHPRAAQEPGPAAGELPRALDADRGRWRASRTTSCRSPRCRCTWRSNASIQRLLEAAT